MKTRALTILALFLLGLAASTEAGAQTAGQSAGGTYQFSLGDGYTKYLEFQARTQTDGSATGSMFLSDEATIVYQDVDGAGDPREKHAGFYLKAEFDSMVVDKNTAVMSGVVRESSLSNLIGQRVLLTVQDNGDNTREPDRLTWGVYKPIVRDWTPSDAELKEDPGVGLSWWATDAEVRGDVGYRMPRDESINTRSFPISSYAFADVDRGAGDIQVNP